jgi:hypothetical protein
VVGPSALPRGQVAFAEEESVRACQFRHYKIETGSSRRRPMTQPMPTTRIESFRRRSKRAKLRLRPGESILSTRKPRSSNSNSSSQHKSYIEAIGRGGSPPPRVPAARRCRSSARGRAEAPPRFGARLKRERPHHRALRQHTRASPGMRRGGDYSAGEIRARRR